MGGKGQSRQGPDARQVPLPQLQEEELTWSRQEVRLRGCRCMARGRREGLGVHPAPSRGQ